MCPFCGQGQLKKWLVKDIDVLSYICNECESAWYRYENIGVTRAGSATCIVDWLGYEPINRPSAVRLIEIVDWPEPAQAASN